MDLAIGIGRHGGHAHEHGAVEAGLAARPLARGLVDDVAAVRDHLVANIAVLNRYWCRFAALFHSYDVDCIKTAPIGADGRFDTDISYFCYGDRPDLYFKVEQRCGNTWTVVHAPSVACNTHWDYCCGDEVEIVVTSETAGLGPAFTPCVPSSASDPAAIGQWQMLPYTSQVFVVHAALMRTGKVLMFSGGVEGQLPKESRVWDPATGSFVAHTFADDLFCAFQVVLGDGRVLVMGGSNYQGPHGQGVNITYTFDPGAPGWVKHANMAFARWYPTAVVLDDGRVAGRIGPGRRPRRRADGAIRSRIEYVDDAAGEREQAPGHLSEPAPDGGREGPLHRHALGRRQQLASTVAVAAGFGALRSGDEHLGQRRGACDPQPDGRARPCSCRRARAPRTITDTARRCRRRARSRECSSLEATADRRPSA